MADNFDKFRPDWTVGTLTLTGGSTAFTATDAELILAAIREGDAIITPTGFFLPIETLAEDGLSGTLSNPAPAAAAGTFDTRIRYQSDNSRFTGALLALTRQLTGGNLQSFGNLQGLQDLMPIFLGPGSVGLINKSEIGIQDPNGSLGKLAALTLAANKAVTTDGSGNAQQIDLGTLGRALLALAAGTSAQIIQADGEIIDKASLPVSTATQAALNNKFNVSGGTINGDVRANGAIYNYTTFTGGNQYGLAHISFIGDQIAMRMLAEHAPGQYYGGLIQVSFPSGSREFYYKSDGSFTAFGPIIGSVKNFEIDHPVDPDHYDLRHCSTEAPEMLVEYRGTAQLVNGSATINVEEYFGVMPGTFDALWADAWVTALQNQDSFDRLKPSRVEGAVFTIICENQNSNDLVSWVVMARRNDAYVLWDGCKSTDANGKLIIEFEKESV
ncbi:hypothetical protein H9643_18760 [Ochrobactrum sp. Sa2BUA5]|nr:hypothetical protein [Ochrobactrum gallinarum]